MNATIKLHTDSILHVPLTSYDNDFTFIVNGVEFKTNHFISNILSPKITKYRLSDPTIDTFVIKTNEKGDFSHFLDLISFKTTEIDEKEIPFFNEIIQKLETTKIEFKLPETKLTLDNIVDTIILHQNYCDFYQENFSKEIDFLASQLFEFKDDRIYELKKIPSEILEKVFISQSLLVDDKDQLLHLVNCLYESDKSNCELYSFVLFSNLSVQAINEFLSIFDLFDITSSVWKSLSKRLSKEIKNDEKNKIEARRYRLKEKVKKHEFNEGMKFEYTNQNFDGIFNYLQKNSSLSNEINMSYSSINYGSPINVFNYNSTCRFGSEDRQDSWLCIELKKHKIIPTNYTIKTSTERQPRNWVIEGSDDGSKWEKIDENINCSFMNGKSAIHTFSIDESHQNKFKYLKMKEVGPNWENNYRLMIESIEFYGFLI